MQPGDHIQGRSLGVDPQPRISTSSLGCHFSGRAQERILNFTVSQDARGSAIEALYVHIVLHRCRSVHHVPINHSDRKQIGRFWTGSTCEAFEMRFRVLQSCLATSGEDFNMLPGALWRHATKPSGKETGRWRFVLGNCSVYCLFGCFSDRRARVVSARLSCAIALTSLEMVSGAHSTKQHVIKHPSQIPSDRTAQNRIWRRGPTQHCKKSSRAKCPAHDNVLLEQLSHRAQRPLPWRCRAKVHKSHPERSHRLCWILSPRNQSRWIGRFCCPA